ncbi:type IV secretion system protein [Campylobacter lanienae]|uniref:type IV secretion system protein n=1 Tax=Campylobacter lanienae TaxID=75658 RepID=UPI000BB40154|nr:type IV secretion system protein [Campylobacter lanienae]
MAKEIAKAQGIDENWIDAVYSALNEPLQMMFEKIFQGISSVLHNGASYTVIGLIVMFWLIYRLKNGYPTREDIFKAGKFIVITSFIFGVFSSYEIYKIFINWFMLPALWVKAGVGDLLPTDVNFGAMISQIINLMDEIDDRFFAIAYNKISNTATFSPLSILSLLDINPFDYLMTIIQLIPWYIYKFIIWILLIGIIGVVLISSFTALIILAGAPLFIPLLMIDSAKQYFWSWLKLFVTYSLYAPVAFIVLSLALSPLAEFQDLMNSINGNQKMELIVLNPWSYFFVKIIIAIIGVYLLIKIPTWISQIMGVNGLDGGGAGLAGMAMGSIGTLAAGAITGGVGAGARGGQLLSGAGRGAVGSIVGGKTALQAYDAMGGYKGISDKANKFGNGVANFANEVASDLRGVFASPNSYKIK